MLRRRHQGPGEGSGSCGGRAGWRARPWVRWNEALVDEWSSGELDEIESLGCTVLSGDEMERLGGREAVLRRARSLSERELRGRPWTRLLAAVARIDQDPNEELAAELIRAANRSFVRQGDHVGQRWANGVRVELALAQDDLAEATYIIERSLDGEHGLLPVDEIRLVGIGVRALRLGQVATANRAFSLFQRYAGERGNAESSRAGRAAIAFAWLRHGDLDRGVAALSQLEQSTDATSGHIDSAAGHLAPLDMRAGFVEPFVLGLSPDAAVGNARATLAALRGDFASAAAELSEAMASARRVPSDHVAALTTLVQLDFVPVDALGLAPSEARRRLADALHAVADHRCGFADRLAGDIRLVRCRLELLEGDAPSALDELAALDEWAGDPFLQGRALLHLAEQLAARGSIARALEAGSAACELFAEMGSTYWAARAAMFLAANDARRADAWRFTAFELSSGDPAFARMFARPGGLRVRVGSVPALEVDGEPVRLPTRHAELVIQLLAVAGPEGIPASWLCLFTWPGADSARSGPRLRTLLWQLRTALGPERWRIHRRDEDIVFDLVDAGVEIDRSLAIALPDDQGERFDQLARVSVELAGVVGLATGARRGGQTSATAIPTADSSVGDSVLERG